MKKKLNILWTLLVVCSCNKVENGHSNSSKETISETSNYCNVYGYVKDDKLNGIEKVEVYLQDNEQKLSYTAITNNEGYYLFKDVFMGNYYLKASYTELELYDNYISNTINIKNDFRVEDIILKNKNIDWGKLQ